MKDIILEMRGITKTFPGVKALDDVNLTVRRGDIHAICGENGAGKSTLMKVLSGVYPHGSYEGQIFYEGQERRFRGISESEAVGIIIIAISRSCRIATPRGWINRCPPFSSTWISVVCSVRRW